MIARMHVNRLNLFGGATLDAASGPITGRAAQRHRVALLALLATTKRLHRSRDQLMTLLWPSADAERGRRLLSDSIYRLNQALGGDAVVGTAEDIRLNRSRLSTDVADFETATDQHDWPRVVHLYDGPFLDGFYLPDSPEFDQWMEMERARYARNVGKALEALANDATWETRTKASVVASLLQIGARRLGVATEVMRVLDADQLASDRTWCDLSPRCNSIAVLPFNNVTGSDEHAHLATPSRRN
jgi:DNA-binding SARP family transcriptional activator